jgi:hypothetical protein
VLRRLKGRSTTSLFTKGRSATSFSKKDVGARPLPRDARLASLAEGRKQLRPLLNDVLLLHSRHLKNDEFPGIFCSEAQLPLLQFLHSFSLAHVLIN